jgi:hypothetical protein
LKIKCSREGTKPALDDTRIDKTNFTAEFRNNMQNKLVSMAIHGNIILRQILKKQDVRLWA